MSASSLAQDIKTFNENAQSFSFKDLHIRFSKIKKVMREPTNYKWSISKASSFVVTAQILPSELLSFLEAFIEACSGFKINGLESFMKFYKTLRSSKEFQRSVISNRINLKPNINKEDFIRTLKKQKMELDKVIDITDADYIDIIQKTYNTGLKTNTIRQYWYTKDYFLN